MHTEKERASIIHFLYIGMILAILYFIFRYLIYYIMPFLLGFLIAFSLRPAIRKTIQCISLPHKLIALFYLLIFYGTIGFALIILSVQGFHYLQKFLENFPYLYESQIEPAIYSLMWRLQQVYSDLDPHIVSLIQDLFIRMNSSLQSISLQLSSFFINIISNIATSLPSIFVSFFITILSSIFFTLDFTNIAMFFMRQFPHNKRTHIYQIRETFSHTILQYGKAYGKLMCITFIELSIGLLYLQVPGAIVVAFIISFFDILPILGTGTIILPWVLISFLNHQQKFAIGLLIMHLIINLIRQVIEPKLVGKQMGIHPLLMLACMFFGVKLFGFLGIFITPILLHIIQDLNAQDVLRLYK